MKKRGNFLQQTVAGAPFVTVTKARPQNSSEFPGITLDRVSFLEAIGMITQSYPLVPLPSLPYPQQLL